MRYYNENPHVTMWRETARHWEQLSKSCLDTARDFRETSAYFEKLVDEANEQAKEAIETAKEWADTTYRFIDKLKEFNALPWYKKMFHKFKV